MTRLGRFKILQNPHLTEECSYQRSWRDRLLSWPWRPWRRRGSRIVPKETIYAMSSVPGRQADMLIMHPAVYARLRDAVAEQEPYHRAPWTPGDQALEPDLQQLIDAMNTLLLRDLEARLEMPGPS